MTYRETLEGERIPRWKCPVCGGNAGEVAVDDTGWNEELDHYVEYARFKCGDCGRVNRVRIVYAEAEWIDGWGDKEEEE